VVASRGYQRAKRNLLFDDEGPYFNRPEATDTA
jgi:hypothetical protein